MKPTSWHQNRISFFLSFYLCGTSWYHSLPILFKWNLLHSMKTYKCLQLGFKTWSQFPRLYSGGLTFVLSANILEFICLKSWMFKKIFFNLHLIIFFYKVMFTVLDVNIFHPINHKSNLFIFAIQTEWHKFPFDFYNFPIFYSTLSRYIFFHFSSSNSIWCSLSEFIASLPDLTCS